MWFSVGVVLHLKNSSKRNSNFYSCLSQKFKGVQLFSSWKVLLKLPVHSYLQYFEILRNLGLPTLKQYPQSLDLHFPLRFQSTKLCAPRHVPFSENYSSFEAFFFPLLREERRNLSRQQQKVQWKQLGGRESNKLFIPYDNDFNLVTYTSQ